MRFNNQINLLRRHCDERGKVARQKYAEAGNRGVSYVSYLWTAEMTYKLETLLERDFLNQEHFTDVVLSLVAEHYTPGLKKLPNLLTEKLIEREEQAFVSLLKSLPSDCPDVSVPYRRILLGDEAEAVKARFEDVWDYCPYWYPLRGDWTPANTECLFVMDEVAEPYWEAILDLLCPNGERVYTTGEHAYSYWLDRPYVAEVDRTYISPCGGSESAYADKGFTRILSISHEQTVAFAGDWVPAVKQILAGERERWNKTFWSD